MKNPAKISDALLSEFIASAALGGSAAALNGLLTTLRSSPHANAEVWQQVASGVIRAGFSKPAAQLLDTAIGRFPHAHDLLYWRGNALRLSMLSELAERDFRDVLRSEPGHRDAALSLAFMLREQGRLAAATEVVVASWHTRGDDPAEVLAMLAFLRECNAYAQAHEIAQAARRRWPENVEMTAIAAEFALAIGEFAIARDCLHATLDRDPRKSASWLRLAYCQRYTRRDDADLLHIEAAWQNPELDALSRTCAGFALGKALDDIGDYAHATVVLRGVNTMARAATTWREDVWQQFVERQLASRTLARVDATPDFAPIFVVGLPRTGTTLVATLLGRDRQVRDRGELNWIDAMYAHLASQNLLHDASALAAVAKLVVAQMRRDDTPARWYLDKNPLNFRYLDLIAALFPQARVIHCRRDPRDTALSLWMQHFAHEDTGFAYDFSTIATFTQGYERLMTHWHTTLALPIFDLDYEALASDAPLTLRRLTDFLGMPSLPDETTQSAPVSVIATASVWQARQPVYTSSIGRWKQYAPFLPELEHLF